MDDSQLLRYSRHILLPEIGIEGQQSFLDAHVLILGAGGLGSPAAMFLAASGVGTLTLCDDDQVDLTNLQRQLAHRTASIGIAKVESARQTLNAINPEVSIKTVQERADEARLTALVAEADIVLDCSDNFPTRYALNRACAAAKKPLVSGAATRFDGQVSVFNFRRPDSPCYNCLYPEDSEAEETRCAVMGVFAPLVGIVGSMQAAEALKLLAGMEHTLHGRLLTLDALTMQPRVMKLARDPQCAVCSGAT
ncbi:MAG: molybdopterin-synthase adenylyltransferase MoeB [Gammaproteobacteria bacterium]|nr:molybdopterin-synthase adenylyltransferase MoeB [Sideroxydans sp.]MBU4045141.1 molybdopterin-synthase adenylyltransferase MoeB [Gammaproteobacteria bacterium]